MIEWEYKRTKAKSLYYVYKNEEWDDDADITYIGAFWAYSEKQAVHFAIEKTGENECDENGYKMWYSAKFINDIY